MNKRKKHIATSIAGLALVAALFVYYLTREDLWKMTANIGFAGLAGLLIWRLMQGLKQEKKKEDE